MLFQQILLKIIEKWDGERSTTASYYLLRGKRSGQTIQDIGTYHLHRYFSILPKLSLEKYKEEFHRLIEEQLVCLNEDGRVCLSELGKQTVMQIPSFKFNGWFYRGNEHHFFNRLALVVQSLSYAAQNEMSFVPVQKSDVVQRWVKQFLIQRDFKSAIFREAIRTEMISSLEKLSVEDVRLDMMLFRLSGYNEPGYTWNQLAAKYQCTELEIQIRFIETLHIWLDYLYSNQTEYPIISTLLEGVRVESPLTDSAKRTYELFISGRSMEEISHDRRLKMSTIEDHFIEIAMNNPSFPVQTFIQKSEIEQVLQCVEERQTKKLKQIREFLPHLSYFQLRLALASKGSH